jgi:DNA-binding transcriptional ArsR family regulator
MVKYGDAGLDRVFAALADPTRRALVARLSEQTDLSVSDLARPFAVSLPAIMKHLDVLATAGLITRQKNGRTVTCRLASGPMEQAMAWLERYQRFWSAQLDRLAAFVEEEAWRTKLQATAQHPSGKPTRKKPGSTSPGISKPRRNSSTRRGRTPKK